MAAPRMAAPRILRLVDAPHHLEIVAAWNYSEWGEKAGESRQDSVDWFRAMATAPSEECVLAEQGGAVIGMASLVDHDLEERPDLLHWLASVYVLPAFRSSGVASALIGAVEQEAALRDIACMHLYTNTAERLYTRLGWEISERFQRGSEEFVIMRKDPRG